MKNGNGSEHAREALSKRLEDMGEIDERGQWAHLTLSSRSRFVFAEGSARTHKIQFVNLGLIAHEVRWGDRRVGDL